MSQSFQVDTDKLEVVATILAAQTQDVETIILDLMEHFNAVQVGSWQGVGAECFEAEMVELILPQMRMLHYFLANTKRQMITFIEKSLELEPAIKQFETERPQREAMLASLQVRQQQLEHALEVIEARTKAMQAAQADAALPDDSEQSAKRDDVL